MDMLLRLFLNEFERTVYDSVVNGTYEVWLHRNSNRYAIRIPKADGDYDAWEIAGSVIRPEHSYTKSIPISKLFKGMIVRFCDNTVRKKEQARIQALKDDALTLIKSHKVTK